MEFLGYALAILVGVSLGLIGAGGSILTVPILVYILKMDAVMATAYSLFIVGITSMVGAIRSYFLQLVNIKTAFLFGIPSIITAYIVRAFVIPAIPNRLFSVGEFIITKSILLLIIFAVVMIIASYKMIQPKINSQTTIHKPQMSLLLINGFGVGILTGLVGAGGGFLIIPALVLVFQMPMNKAVGTSLLIITMNTLFSFFGSIQTIQPQLVVFNKVFIVFNSRNFYWCCFEQKNSRRKIKTCFWLVYINNGNLYFNKRNFYKIEVVIWVTNKFIFFNEFYNTNYNYEN
jgi:uncharacterized membrane protein YfcA